MNPIQGREFQESFANYKFPELTSECILALPTYFEGHHFTDLKGKVKDLENAQESLRDAKDSSMRDRVRGFLLSALAVTIIGGIVLGTVGGGVALALSTGLPWQLGLVCIPLPLLAVMVLGIIHNGCMGGPIKPLNRSDCLWPIKAGIAEPFLPFLNAFNKASRYQESMEEKRGEYQRAVKGIIPTFLDWWNKSDTDLSDLKFKISKKRAEHKKLKTKMEHAKKTMLNPGLDIEYCGIASNELDKLKKNKTDLELVIKFRNVFFQKVKEPLKNA